MHILPLVIGIERGMCHSLITVENYPSKYVQITFVSKDCALSVYIKKSRQDNENGPLPKFYPNYNSSDEMHVRFSLVWYPDARNVEKAKVTKIKKKTEI